MDIDRSDVKCVLGEPAVQSYTKDESGSGEDFSESEDEGLSGYRRGATLFEAMQLLQ